LDKFATGSEGVKSSHHYNLENNVFQVKKGGCPVWAVNILTNFAWLLVQKMH